MTTEDQRMIQQFFNDEIKSIRENLIRLEKKIDNLSASMVTCRTNTESKINKLTIVLVVLAGLSGNLSEIIKVFISGHL